MVYTLRFFSLQNAVCFIILTYLVAVLFTFYIQDVLKFKKIIPAQKVNRAVEKYLSIPSGSFPYGCFRPNFVNIHYIFRLCRMRYIHTFRLSRPSPYSQLTNKLTNHKGESRSWEANSSSGSSEITHAVMNPKLHHAVRKSISSIPIPNHTTNVHAP